METTPTLPHPRRDAARLLLGLLAVVAIAAGAVLGPARAARATEFDPKPAVTSNAQCKGDPAQFVVQLNLFVNGNVAGHFHVDADIDGIHQVDDITVLPGVETPTYVVPEGKTAKIEVTSPDLASIDHVIDVPAVDCVADPTASITVECPATPGAKPYLVYTYANPSAVPVYFAFGTPNGGSFGFSVVNQPGPKEETYEVAEGDPIDIGVQADNIEIAHLTTKVNCIPDPHIVTVSKTVIGGVGNPAFHFTVSCGSNFPDTLVEAFDLHDGESHPVAVPAGGVCEAREVNYPKYVTITHSLDGAAPEESSGTFPFPSKGDHAVHFVNTVWPQHVVTIHKAVKGGQPGATFSFTIDCLVESAHEITPFTLADGQSKAFPLVGTTECEITEADPGAGWTTTHALDALPPKAGRSQLVLNDADHFVGFVNTLPEQPTTTTTTTTSTTTTMPTTTSTTVPDTTSTLPETTTTEADVPETVPTPLTFPTTVPATTEATSSTTTAPAPTAPATTEPAAVSGEVIEAAPAPATPGLARTGSDVVALAAAGSLLLALGLVLVLATRRSNQG